MKSKRFNLYVQPIAVDKCPHCGASNKPRSKSYKPNVQPASFGVYINGKYRCAFHACMYCYSDAVSCVIEPYDLTSRSGYSVPQWLLGGII